MYRCRSATVSPQTVATKDFQQNVGNSANTYVASKYGLYMFVPHVG